MKQELEEIANQFKFREAYDIRTSDQSILFHTMIPSSISVIIGKFGRGTYTFEAPNIYDNSKLDILSKEEVLTAVKEYISNMPRFRLEHFVANWRKWVNPENNKSPEKIMVDSVKLLNRTSTEWEKRFAVQYLSEYHRESTTQENQKANSVLEDIKNDTSLPDITYKK